MAHSIIKASNNQKKKKILWWNVYLYTKLDTALSHL